MRFGTLKNITNDKNNIGIYEIKNGNKKYIGSSKNLRRRLYCHKRNLEQGLHKNAYMQYDYNISPNSFKFSIIRTVDTISEAKRLEEELIATGNYVYNIQNNENVRYNSTTRHNFDSNNKEQILERLIKSYNLKQYHKNSIYMLLLEDVSFRLKMSEGNIIRTFFPKVHLAPECHVTYGKYSVCMAAYDNEFVFNIVCGNGTELIDLRDCSNCIYSSDSINQDKSVHGRQTGSLDKLNCDLIYDIKSYLSEGDVTQAYLCKKHNISRNTLKKYISYIQQQAYQHL